MNGQDNFRNRIISLIFEIRSNLFFLKLGQIVVVGHYVNKQENSS